MSKRKPAEIVQDIYAAFGRRDGTAIIAALAEDVSWTVHGPKTIPYTGTTHGKPAVQTWFETLARTVTVDRFTIDRLVAEGEAVAAFGSFACTVNATNKPYATKFVHLWRIPNGSVAAFEDFFDTATAAAAHVR
jgi:hypothetical protein